MVFGTDGIRGIVDEGLTPKLAYNIGKAFGFVLNKAKKSKKVIIGTDTRISKDVYATAISCGLMDNGIDVIYVGIVSTPMISFLVSKYDCIGGIMITASHNDYRYNGIKLFDGYGRKLSKKQENYIESLLLDENKIKNISVLKGRLIVDNDLKENYINYLLSSFNMDLHNITIVLDCANGSNYNIAPSVYNKLGANVIKISSTDNGNMINDNCGANCIDNIKSQVSEHNADFGFAFDGDGDRLCVVYKNGFVLCGDDLLLLFAKYLKKNNKLNKLSLVGTIMTNLGLEKKLLKTGIILYRTDVGDKNVINLIEKHKLSLGGEPSGHICLPEFNPTCDALINSLFFLKCVLSNPNMVDEILEDYKYPSLIINKKVDLKFRESFDSNIEVLNSIKKLSRLHKDAKIIVRPSGTESVIRIYVESKSQEVNNIISDKILKLLKKIDI